MRVGTLPAQALKTVAQGIAALLILQTLRLDLIARTVQAGDSSLLDREEHTKVDLAAQLGKGRDHILATDQKADTRTGDVKRLGEREELHAHLERAGILQEASARLAVKHDIGIRVVMDDEQVVLAGESDDLLVDLGRAHRAHRVGGQRHNHVLGTIGHLGIDTRHIGQVIVLRHQRIVLELGIGDLGTRLKDRVARIGNQDGVTRIEQGQAQMAHALLRAVARLHHGRCNARNAKATLIVIAHGLFEFGQVAQGVLPHLGILGRLCERLDHVAVRLKVGRAHAHVVNGLALSLQREQLVVERGEDLRAKAVETLRCLHGATFRYKNAALRQERRAIRAIRLQKCNACNPRIGSI